MKEFKILIGNGSTGTTLYIKEANTDNTGWQLIISEYGYGTQRIVKYILSRVNIN